MRVPASWSLLASWRKSTLGPFHYGSFAAIWIGTLATNFSGLIQIVGASWLMTSLAPSPSMVALVPASSYFPVIFLSLLAGASADIWDRRLIMLACQALLLLLSATLSVLTLTGRVTPGTLLLLTSLIGCAAALYLPAWQASIVEQVPPSEASAVISLNSLSLNLARTLGPAIGGIMVATVGPAAAFVTNSLTYLGFICVLSGWRRTQRPAPLPPERVLTAMRTGVSYVRLSPGIRTVLVRVLVFGLTGGSVTALLPLVARDLLHGGAVNYGLLFSAFGTGAVLGALSSASARKRYRNETVVSTATLGYATSIAAVGASTWQSVTAAALVLGGASWVTILSTFATTAQISAPQWVVGRVVAIYLMANLGSLAIGFWCWGALASEWGLPVSLLSSGALVGLSALLGRRLPLPQPERLNLAPRDPWPEDWDARNHRIAHAGRVVVTVEYCVAMQDAPAFRDAMRELQRIRTRDGLQRWSLLQDAADPQRWVESYRSPSWVEHLRCHHRLTVADQEIEQRVLALHSHSQPPTVRHLLESA